MAVSAEIRERLSAHVRAFMWRKKLGTRPAAKFLGVAGSTIHRYIYEDRVPETETLVALIFVAGIDAWDLFRADPARRFFEKGSEKKRPGDPDPSAASPSPQPERQRRTAGT